jgi:hypothetical protein
LIVDGISHIIGPATNGHAVQVRDVTPLINAIESPKRIGHMQKSVPGKFVVVFREVIGNP